MADYEFVSDNGITVQDILEYDPERSQWTEYCNWKYIHEVKVVTRPKLLADGYSDENPLYVKVYNKNNPDVWYICEAHGIYEENVTAVLMLHTYNNSSSRYMTLMNFSFLARNYSDETVISYSIQKGSNGLYQNGKELGYTSKLNPGGYYGGRLEFSNYDAFHSTTGPQIKLEKDSIIIETNMIVYYGAFNGGYDWVIRNIGTAGDPFYPHKDYTEVDADTYAQLGKSVFFPLVPPTPIVKEFDFYYRARYGAEFPWPEEPEPGPDVPTTAMIAGTWADANSPASGTKNLEVLKEQSPTTPDGFLNPDYDPDKEYEKSKIYDRVTYNYLTPGETYILVAQVYDVTDGKYISEAETEKQFVAADVYGDETVEILIDGRQLEGHTLCIFENLYTHDDHYLHDHSDPRDQDQHIYVLAAHDAYEEDDDEEAPYFCAVDENFNAIGIIDYYESLIWTDRFDKAGDFELYTLVTEELMKMLKVDTYFYIPQSNKHMIVEKIEIKSDPDEGDKLTVTGRSLESILDRRVVWKKTTISGNLQQSLKKIFQDNIINPPVGERRIANFVFKDSTDPKITGLTLEAEYFGDNIYELVCNVCQTNHIGFRVTLNASNQFVFELYSGEDRSYDNPHNNTYIIFGAEWDNVQNSNYVENKENFKNVALVGTSSDSTTSSYGNKDHTGLSRRETYVSATDIDKDQMTKDQYKSALSDKGREALKDYKNIRSFDGTMLNTGLVYLKDFGLGDVIEFVDIYGHQEKTRISEYIISHDRNGYKTYPAFEALEG